MNLRGFGAYFVCVGNMFSGLYVPIKADEKRKPTVFVRRPQRRDADDNSNTTTGTATMTATSSSSPKHQSTAAVTTAGAAAVGTAAAGSALGLTGLVSLSTIAAEQPSRALMRPWTRDSQFTVRRQKQLGKRMQQLQRGANLVLLYCSAALLLYCSAPRFPHGHRHTHHLFVCFITY
jgi:predicted aconitase